MQVLAVGLERLSALLSQMIGAESQDTFEIAGQSVDLMLRIIDSANAAPRQGPSAQAVLSARHGLIDLLSVALHTVERLIASPHDEDGPLIEGATPPQPSALLAIIVKLLKFVLGLFCRRNFGFGRTEARLCQTCRGLPARHSGK